MYYIIGVRTSVGSNVIARVLLRDYMPDDDGTCVEMYRSTDLSTISVEFLRVSNFHHNCMLDGTYPKLDPAPYVPTSVRSYDLKK